MMNRSASFCLLVITFSATTLACGGAKSPPAIDGNWAITGAVLAGTGVPLTVFQNAKLRLVGGVYAFQADTGEYSVMADSTPIAIDVRGKIGPNAGRTIPAILKIQGDTLTICYDLSGKARPKEFKSDSGSQLFLARYSRSVP